MQEDKTVFDKDVVLKMFEGEEEFLKELVEIFINDIPEQISKIKEAVNSLNSSDLKKSAHKLKGAVINFGENATFKTALRLEKMGRENRMDGVEEVYGTLVKDVDRLVNALKEFVKSE